MSVSIRLKIFSVMFHRSFAAEMCVGGDIVSHISFFSSGDKVPSRYPPNRAANLRLRTAFIVTYTKEVMFLVQFVCWFSET